MPPLPLYSANETTPPQKPERPAKSRGTNFSLQTYNPVRSLLQYKTTLLDLLFSQMCSNFSVISVSTDTPHSSTGKSTHPLINPKMSVSFCCCCFILLHCLHLHFHSFLWFYIDHHITAAWTAVERLLLLLLFGIVLGGLFCCFVYVVFFFLLFFPMRACHDAHFEHHSCFGTYLIWLLRVQSCSPVTVTWKCV